MYKTVYTELLLLIPSIFEGGLWLYTIFPSPTNLGRPHANGSFLTKHGYCSLGLLLNLEFYDVLLSVLAQIQHSLHMREGTGYIPAARQALWPCLSLHQMMGCICCLTCCL